MDMECVIIETETKACVSSQSLNSSSMPSQSTSASASASTIEQQDYPSKLAALVAHKIKIKKEKVERQAEISLAATSSSSVVAGLGDQEELSLGLSLSPQSNRDQFILSQLRQMGFMDDKEIMIALRTIERKHERHRERDPNGMSMDMDINMDVNMGMSVNIDTNSLVEEIMMYIVTQREEQSEAQKMDIAREQSETIVAQEQKIHDSSMKDIMNSASVDDIIGTKTKEEEEDDDDTNIITSTTSIHSHSHQQNSEQKCLNSSIHFPSSTLLNLAKVKKQFRWILSLEEDDNSDISNNHDLRTKIVHLFTLECKAFKWFGEKIPYAYFGITLPDRIVAWSDRGNDKANDNDNECTLSPEVIEKEDKERTIKAVHKKRLLKLLQIEIDLIEHGMYSLSEQEQGDLQKLPKIFMAAKRSAVTKGLILDHSCDDNLIIIDD